MTKIKKVTETWVYEGDEEMDKDKDKDKTKKKGNVKGEKSTGVYIIYFCLAPLFFTNTFCSPCYCVSLKSCLS